MEKIIRHHLLVDETMFMTWDNFTMSYIISMRNIYSVPIIIYIFIIYIDIIDVIIWNINNIMLIYIIYILLSGFWGFGILFPLNIMYMLIMKTLAIYIMIYIIDLLIWKVKHRRHHIFLFLWGFATNVLFVVAVSHCLSRWRTLWRCGLFVLYLLRCRGRTYTVRCRWMRGL